jgi:hypothetical protein
MSVFLNRALALRMEAVSTSESSVNFCQTTRRNIAEDSHLLTMRTQPEIKYSQIK